MNPKNQPQQMSEDDEMEHKIGLVADVEVTARGFSGMKTLMEILEFLESVYCDRCRVGDYAVRHTMIHTPVVINGVSIFIILGTYYEVTQGKTCGDLVNTVLTALSRETLCLIAEGGGNGGYHHMVTFDGELYDQS